MNNFLAAMESDGSMRMSTVTTLTQFQESWSEAQQEFASKSQRLVEAMATGTLAAADGQRAFHIVQKIQQECSRSAAEQFAFFDKFREWWGGSSKDNQQQLFKRWRDAFVSQLRAQGTRAKGPLAVLTDVALSSAMTLLQAQSNKGLNGAREGNQRKGSSGASGSNGGGDGPSNGGSGSGAGGRNRRRGSRGSNGGGGNNQQPREAGGGSGSGGGNGGAGGERRPSA